MPRKFKYTASFNRCFIKASVHAESDKYVSLASLDVLKGLEIPESVNLQQNLDLVVAIYNGAVVNRLNKNDDGIDTKTALAIKKLFLHKPTNLEHKKSRTVGHIVAVGWSRFGTNELLTDEQVKDMTEPFNMVIASVVYRLNEEKFSDMLVESADETSALYNTISASWEIGFDDYALVVGSKNLNEAEIITDPKKIEELAKYLRALGGKGVTPDGKYIGRLVVGNAGDVLPYGFAFTNKPAADVKGVALLDFSDLEDSSETDEVESSEASEVSNQQSEEKSQESEKNISISNEITVIKNRENTMASKIKTVDDVLALLPQDSSEAKESVSDFIKKGLEDAAKEWETKISEKDTALAEANKQIDELKKSAETSATELKTISAEFKQLKETVAAQAQESAFQTRMDAIASEFELTKDENALVAKKIRSLSEEQYTEWYKEFAILASDKKKETIAARKAELDSKLAEEAEKAKKEISHASEANKTEDKSEGAEEVLDNAVEKKDQSIANTQTPEEDLFSQFGDAFKDCVKIQY